jgi:hypothetical protein
MRAASIDHYWLSQFRSDKTRNILGACELTKAALRREDVIAEADFDRGAAQRFILQLLVALVKTGLAFNRSKSKLGGMAETKCEIRLGDCAEVLREYPSDFFDLIVTSPPYADSRARRDFCVLSSRAAFSS